MAKRNKKQTSSSIATKASKILRDEEISDDDIKAVAASALAQAKKSK